MTRSTPLIIDGQDHPASDGATFNVQHPYSVKLVGTSASASSDHYKTAVDPAARAFKSWDLTEKRDIFFGAAQIVKTEKYRLGTMESMEQETVCSKIWEHFELDRNERLSAGTGGPHRPVERPSFFLWCHSRYRDYAGDEQWASFMRNFAGQAP